MSAAAAILSALHLLALGIGLPAIYLRARWLAQPLDVAGIRRVLGADLAWGIAAALWILTGPARAFGPMEKGTTFYLQSMLFWTKLSLFLLVVAFEIPVMIGMARWRSQLKDGTPDLSRAASYARISKIELHLVVTIVFVAAFMARGFGLGRP